MSPVVALWSAHAVRRASLCLEGAYVQETAQSTLNSALHHTYGYKQPAVLSLSGGMPAMTRDLVVYVLNCTICTMHAMAAGYRYYRELHLCVAPNAST